MSLTQKALVALEKEQGRPWREVLTQWAREGYSWADVASFIDVSPDALKQWCHKRQLKFPWMGNASPIKRAHLSNLNKGRPATKDHWPHYTAHGFTGTLPDLVRQFYPRYGVTYNVALTRLNKGWDIERALTTPLMTPSDKARYANQQRRRHDASQTDTRL